MSRNIIFLAIALIGLSLFIFPSTLSMFAGQHSFIKPQDIDCKKCHMIIYEEMISGNYGMHSPHRTADTVFECIECHNVAMNISYYYSTGIVGNHTSAHAASTISCIACHGDLFSNGTAFCKNNSCHTDTFPSNEVNTMHVLATKYSMGHNGTGPDYCLKCHRYVDDEENITRMRENVFINNVDDNFADQLESHRDFFWGSKNITGSESGLSDSNEACLSCHSAIGTNISWTRKTTITFTADKSDGNWSITNLNATGNKTNITSNLG
jgi:hypothetical protein